jgi:hypothetical protein
MKQLLTAGLLATAVCSGLVAAPASAGTIYDPALGSLPSAQGWLTTGAGPYVQGVSGGVYSLDTSASNAVLAGSALLNPAALNTAAGFTIDFDLRVIAESHARPERGGFSMIVTGADPTHALELAFWNDRVFAYTSTFAHGAEALFDTSAFTQYSLVIADNHYAFSGNGAALLSGSLVDYSARGTPYNQAGFLFFGDDTTSAQAHVELGKVTVGPVPEPDIAGLLAAGLALVGWRMRRAPR